MAFLGFLLIRTLLLTSIPYLIMWDLTDASNKRLCGKELSATLEFICENNYNGFGKKSGNGEHVYNDDQYIDDDDNIFYQFSKFPNIDKIHSGALFPKIRRLRHGVSDECCKKSCTFKELSSYCKYPLPTVQ